MHDNAPDGTDDGQCVARRDRLVGIGPVGRLAKADKGHGVDGQRVDVGLDTARTAAASPRCRHHVHLSLGFFPHGPVNTVGGQWRKCDAQMEPPFVAVD